MLYQPASTLTGSLKSTVMLASCGTVLPLVEGSVPATHGPNSTMGAVRRGFGVCGSQSRCRFDRIKSPPLCLKIAELLPGAGALALPS
jgi:hypothetical protein